MIDTERQRQIDELVELNKQLLTQNEELKAEHEELTRQVTAGEQLAALQSENAELREQLAAASAGVAKRHSATAAYDRLAELAGDHAARTGVTFEKAFAKVAAEQPGLMQQHRDELRRAD